MVPRWSPKVSQSSSTYSDLAQERDLGKVFLGRVLSESKRAWRLVLRWDEGWRRHRESNSGITVLQPAYAPPYVVVVSSDSTSLVPRLVQFRGTLSLFRGGAAARPRSFRCPRSAQSRERLE